MIGIHPTEHAFRRAYDYTPFLSALIWIGRLSILEYALPLRPYTSLPIPWPARDEYPDMGQRLRLQIRPKYLERGSLTPVGYLIERLRHGRAIAKREGARTNISWSINGQRLAIDDTTITVPQFRQMIHSVIGKTQQQLDSLTFDWWPEMQLENVKDDMCNRRPGYCFVSDPVNHLQNKFRVLSQRAFSPQIGKFSWKGVGRTRVIQYLHRCDQFIQSLFAAIHMSSGMPARGEELSPIRWANTAVTIRNIICF